MAVFRRDPIMHTGYSRATWGNVKRYWGYGSMLREISVYPEFNRKTKSNLPNPMFDEKLSSRQEDRIRSWKRCRIKHQWEKNLR